MIINTCHLLQRLFVKYITLVLSGDSGSGCSCCSCNGSERNYARVKSSNITECCPHDYWRSIVKLVCAKECDVVHNGFTTQCHIIDIKKFNVIRNFALCIKWQPLHTATSAVSIINSEKPCNIDSIWCN